MTCPFFDETSVGKCFACQVPYTPTIDEMQELCCGYSFPLCARYALHATGELMGDEAAGTAAALTRSNGDDGRRKRTPKKAVVPKRISNTGGSSRRNRTGYLP